MTDLILMRNSKIVFKKRIRRRNYWFGLANWAKKNDYLTPLDRKNAFNYGTMRSRNRSFKSLKQAQIALKLIEKAKELGYKG